MTQSRESKVAMLKLPNQLKLLEEKYKDAYALAQLASLAFRIEPGLLRELRLRFSYLVSKRYNVVFSVASESRLWFSGIVSSRSSSAISIETDYGTTLRTEFFQNFEASECDQVYQFVQEYHNRLPGELKWLEQINYISAVGGNRNQVERDNRLRLSLMQMADSLQGNDALAIWLDHLPENMRAHLEDLTQRVAKIDGRTDSYGALQVEFEDGTNVPKGSEFSDVSSRSWNVYLPSAPPKNKKCDWQDILNHLHEFRSSGVNLTCRLIQTIVPKIGNRPTSTSANEQQSIRMTTGLRKELSQLFPANNLPLSAQYPFVDVTGRPITNNAGEPTPLRQGFSRMYFIYENSSASNRIASVLRQQLWKELEAASSGLMGLSANTATSIWLNWLDGFDNEEFGKDALWFDALFELAFSQTHSFPFSTKRFVRVSPELYASGKIELIGNGLYPRLPPTISQEVFDSIPNQIGYPAFVEATIPDLVQASIDAIEWIQGNEMVNEDSQSSRTVFVLYADARNWEQFESVKNFAQCLSRNGLQPVVDFMEKTIEDLLPWMHTEAENADYVAVILSEELFERDREHRTANEKRRVYFETQVLYSLIRSTSNKLIPIVFNPADERWLPESLNGYECLYVDPLQKEPDDSDKLLRRIRGANPDSFRNQPNDMTNNSISAESRSLVFLSFSYSDDTYRRELREFLKADEEIGKFFFDDLEVEPGTDWDEALKKAVSQARVMIMLVSPRYLDKRKCKAWKYEIPAALEAAAKEELTILWVASRQVRITDTPFSGIQSCYPPSRPLNSLDESQRAEVYERIRDEAKRILGKSPTIDQEEEAPTTNKLDNELTTSTASKYERKPLKTDNSTDQVKYSQEQRPYEFADVAVEDGTNVPKGTKYRTRERRIHRDLYVPSKAKASQDWQIDFAKLLQRFVELSDSGVSIRLRSSQLRIPESPGRSTGTWMDESNDMLFFNFGSTDQEKDSGPLIDERGRPLFGLFPFTDAGGRPIQNTVGEPFAWRYEYSRSVVVYGSPIDITIFEDASKLLSKLPAELATRIWTNWPEGFSAKAFERKELWLNALLEFGWELEPRDPLHIPRYALSEDLQTRIQLTDKGLFPRIPRTVSKDDLSKIKHEFGFPVEIHSEIQDVINYSNAFLQRLIGEPMNELLQPLDIHSHLERMANNLIATARSPKSPEAPVSNDSKDQPSSSTQQSMKSIRVLISYSHDSEYHRKRVAEFANRLRQDGIDCWIDQFEPHPSQGWPMWMEQQIQRADFVLMICTDRYLKRFNGNEVPGVGRGVIWESTLIRNELYERGYQNGKFIAVGFEKDFQRFIPDRLKGETQYQLEDFSSDNPNYTNLYRYLTGQLGIQASQIGQLVRLPALEPKNCISTVNGIRDASRLLRNGLQASKTGSSQRFESAYALRYLGFDSTWPAVANFILDNEFWMFIEPNTDTAVRQSIFDDFRIQRHALRTKKLVPFAIWVADPNEPTREVANDSQFPVICVEGISGLREFLNDEQLLAPQSRLSKFATLKHVLFDENISASQRIESEVTAQLRKRWPGESIVSTAVFWNVDLIPAHHGNAIKGSQSMNEMSKAVRLV